MNDFLCPQFLLEHPKKQLRRSLNGALSPTTRHIGRSFEENCDKAWVSPTQLGRMSKQREEVSSHKSFWLAFFESCGCKDLGHPLFYQFVTDSIMEQLNILPFQEN